ncbi:hypothetical protein PUN28_000742 [Cardiocondyla obscurior]|uniref:Uncharacterized protein n=1 Tax=Cardiocondyla obscurior TaxID=286306 RepID=A0AAW2H1A4_9HYME
MSGNLRETISRLRRGDVTALIERRQRIRDLEPRLQFTRSHLPLINDFGREETLSLRRAPSLVPRNGNGNERVKQPALSRAQEREKERAREADRENRGRDDDDDDDDNDDDDDDNDDDDDDNDDDKDKDKDDNNR